MIFYNGIIYIFNFHLRGLKMNSDILPENIKQLLALTGSALFSALISRADIGKPTLSYFL